MNRLLLLLAMIFIGANTHAQLGYLFVKKGAKKKKTYEEGGRIRLQLQDGEMVNGLITLLKNDTIWINGRAIPRPGVSAVIVKTKRERKKFQVPARELLLITAGAVLTTAGLSLSHQASFKKAATAAAVIGYGPILIQWIGSKFSFSRWRYPIGNKYRLLILEFHMPPQRGF